MEVILLQLWEGIVRGDLVCQLCCLLRQGLLDCLLLQADPIDLKLQHCPRASVLLGRQLLQISIAGLLAQCCCAALSDTPACCCSG